jgi:hypothetical protein
MEHRLIHHHPDLTTEQGECGMNAETYLDGAESGCLLQQEIHGRSAETGS